MDAGRVTTARARPRLRGVSHEAAFYLAVASAPFLILSGATDRARFAAAVFAGAVVAMFGSSALYHRVTWSRRMRRLLCRVDHGAIYLLIAASYTPCCLLVLRDGWRAALLAVVWGGCVFAAAAKAMWVEAPKWLAAVTAVVLGGVGVVALPKLAVIGSAGLTLLVIGGGLYALGAVVYALKRPDPFPTVFGYHELFHALVVGAVACNYVAVGFWVLPHR